MKLIQYIKEYFSNRKINKVVRKIEKYLNGYTVSISSLKREKEKLQTRRSIITNEQISMIKTRFQSVVTYFSEDRPHNVDLKTASNIEGMGSYALNSPAFQAVMKKFITLKDEFFGIYKRLESDCRTLNEIIETYISRAEKWAGSTV